MRLLRQALPHLTAGRASPALYRFQSFHQPRLAEGSNVRNGSKADIGRRLNERPLSSDGALSAIDCEGRIPAEAVVINCVITRTPAGKALPIMRVSSHQTVSVAEGIEHHADAPNRPAALLTSSEQRTLLSQKSLSSVLYISASAMS